VPQGSVFAVFPTAAVITALGVGALVIAYRQSAEAGRSAETPGA